MSDDSNRPADDLAAASVAAIVHDAICAVAPEVDAELADLDRQSDLWSSLQLDSMDHLAVMTKLTEVTGREIPESDYPFLLSLDAIERYLSESPSG
ncbi:MAG: acyl carrier protein [Acidimicrobiia bacterium]|nr:acyl carrier protein [Acidimicrobiia bacterium]